MLLRCLIVPVMWATYLKLMKWYYYTMLFFCNFTCYMHRALDAWSLHPVCPPLHWMESWCLPILARKGKTYVVPASLVDIFVRISKI